MKLGILAILSLILSGACLAQPVQSGELSKTEAVPAALLLEYVRVIDVLQKGIQQNWDGEKYLSEFDKSSDLGTANEHLTAARLIVRKKLVTLARPHAIWDEQPPVGAEARRLLDESKQARDWLLTTRQS